jgi:hypothetical protein
MSVLLPLDKAAEALGGISVWTLRKHIARGNVRVTHLGRRVFVGEEEMARIMLNGLPSLGGNAIQTSHDHQDNGDGSEKAGA